MTFRVLALSTLPPLIRLSGHKPIHEANAAGLRKDSRRCARVPTSLISTESSPHPPLGRHSSPLRRSAIPPQRSRIRAVLAHPALLPGSFGHWALAHRTGDLGAQRGDLFIALNDALQELLPRLLALFEHEEVFDPIITTKCFLDFTKRTAAPLVPQGGQPTRIALASRIASIMA